MTESQFQWDPHVLNTAQLEWLPLLRGSLLTSSQDGWCEASISCEQKGLKEEDNIFLFSVGGIRPLFHAQDRSLKRDVDSCLLPSHDR